MKKIVVLDGFAMNPGDLSWEPLERLGTLVRHDRTAPHETYQRCEGAFAILTNKVVIDKDLICRLAPTLRYIGVTATGYNVVDTVAAKEAGICVTNIPAYSTHAVAQMVMAHLLAMCNHVEHYSRQVCEEGKWTSSKDFCYTDLPLKELYGHTIGIVGLGAIGMAVAHIAQAFGMKVTAYTSKPQEALPPFITSCSMEALCAQSDVVSLHCPLTPDTHHLVSTAWLAQMKEGSILINTGRGPLVDEHAVAAALHSGHLGAYCADVLSEEPARADNPLLSAPRVQLTPHIAWATQEARQRLLNCCADNLAAFIQGKPTNIVNK